LDRTNLTEPLRKEVPLMLRVITEKAAVFLLNQEMLTGGKRQVYTPGMTLKNAALLAFIGMALLTVVCAVGFIGDISALFAGAITPVMVLQSLIHLLASLSVAVFLYVFHKMQS